MFGDVKRDEVYVREVISEVKGNKVSGKIF